jgi:oligopeptide/dipeptide ABC transporter ATP-binding protein
MTRRQLPLFHPYGKKRGESAKQKRIPPQGEIPDSVNKPFGCGFNTRCVQAKDINLECEPWLEKGDHDHWVSCHTW